MSTFVLIHGAGDAGWYWHLVEAELRARGHDVVASDLPADDDSAGLNEYADAVVEAVGDRKNLIVVGQSFGAFTATLVADRLPVDMLVLVAGMIPSPGGDSQRLVGQHRLPNGGAGAGRARWRQDRQRRPADDDPDLEVVRKRRDEVFDAVSVEVRDEDVMVEAALDYEPFPDDDQPAYVPRPPDTFEMLMIDLALSRDITGEPLRNPSEVDIVVARSRTGTLLSLAGVIELLAAVSTALAVTLASLRYHARFEIALGVAMVTFAVLTFPALALRGGTAYARPPAPLALSHLCRLADR